MYIYTYILIDVKNYRPVSIIPIMSTIFDSCIEKFLKANLFRIEISSGL